MKTSSKGIWLPVIIGLLALLYAGIGFANLDFGSGNVPLPGIGLVVFVICIFWAASKGQGKNRDL